MKAAKIPILLTLFVGGVLGYIVACNNVKPAADASAAPGDKSEKAADASAALSTVENPARAPFRSNI